MRRIDTMNNVLDALNFRGIIPLKWVWNLPLPAFTKEKRALTVLNDVFGEILHKNAVNYVTDITLTFLGKFTRRKCEFDFTFD